MNGHVLLCGLGQVGWAILQGLRAAGLSVVAIDTKADPADARLHGVRLVHGDCRDPEVLRTAGVEAARGVIVATSDDLLNISCALLVRRLSPDVRIVLRMFNQNLVTRLGKAVPNVTALSVSALTAPLLALTAITGEVVAAFPVAQERRQVADITVTPGSPLVDHTVGAITARNVWPLAHLARGRSPRVLHEISPEAPVADGDRLVVVGRPADIRRIVDPGGADSGDVLFAGRIRRFGRVAYRTFAAMDLAVKVCTIAVVLVVTASTAVYSLGLGHTWADALYRTISVISTGADLGGREYEGWGKVFVSVLRIFGTMLIAAFTAIFTNYLIRARLGGAFEARRIPDRGHVVVIGLGNVGYRVAEQLVGMGEPVVVIEKRVDNAFATACRRLGAAVITGDATLRDTLLQARVKEARAVIVATAGDLINLEIALLVAELNEKQRVVVRLGDSVLAETARTAAGVKMAVALPEVAGPAFVAALLGDRVLSVFSVDGRMLAALEIAATATDHTLTDRSLRALSIDFALAPVAVLTADGHERAPSEVDRLSDGDRLVAIAAVADMDRIARRGPLPAEWAVEVESFPLPAREDLVLQLRQWRGLSAAEAEAVMAALPFRIAERQTRGQAEDLVARLARERVQSRAVR